MGLEQDLSILLRIAVAMLLGATLGIEREMGKHAAGLRTHMLIAGAAALIVGLGDSIAEHFQEERYRDLLQVDPSCSVLIAEESGHLALYEIARRLSVVDGGAG